MPSQPLQEPCRSKNGHSSTIPCCRQNRSRTGDAVQKVESAQKIIVDLRLLCNAAKWNQRFTQTPSALWVYSDEQELKKCLKNTQKFAEIMAESGNTPPAPPPLFRDGELWQGGGSDALQTTCCPAAGGIRLNTREHKKSMI